MSMTQDLHDVLMLDLPLRPAMLCDFGLITNGTEQHTALQKAIRAGMTVADLDRIIGNGERITKLVKELTGLDVDFTTVYDTM